LWSEETRRKGWVRTDVIYVQLGKAVVKTDLKKYARNNGEKGEVE